MGGVPTKRLSWRTPMVQRQQQQRVARRSLEVKDAARERLAERVDALGDPASYPGDVERVETVETHMSWVFLTETRAYKLKKPIRTERLDYRTVDARRRACETEFVLNRRLADPAYFGVVPVVEVGEDLYVGEEEGRPVDWLVEMRRLPREAMLDERIERADLAPTDIDRLGGKLAHFYQVVEREPAEPRVYRERIVSDLVSKGASLSQPRYGIDKSLIDAVLARQQDWIDDCGDALEARGGAVVEAHGDLRPEHIYFDGEPLIIDCLEFDRSLRLLDPVSELAFLGLECRRAGSAWIGDRVLSLYEERTGDVTSDALVAFYQSYHAVVRAVIAVWHLDDRAIDSEKKWRRNAEQYLEVARRLL